MLAVVVKPGLNFKSLTNEQVTTCETLEYALMDAIGPLGFYFCS